MLCRRMVRFLGATSARASLRRSPPPPRRNGTARRKSELKLQTPSTTLRRRSERLTATGAIPGWFRRFRVRRRAGRRRRNLRRGAAWSRFSLGAETSVAFRSAKATQLSRSERRRISILRSGATRNRQPRPGGAKGNGWPVGPENKAWRGGGRDEGTPLWDTQQAAGRIRVDRQVQRGNQAQASLSTFSPGRSIFNDWGNWYALRERCARASPAWRHETETMSGISAITTPGASLAQLLSQSESGPSDSTSDLDSLLASGLQNITSDGQSDATAADSTGSGASSGLQDQVQSAISAAIESAEQAGGGNLKTTVYNALVQVLTSNGIDPKTFQATGTGSELGLLVDCGLDDKQRALPGACRGEWGQRRQRPGGPAPCIAARQPGLRRPAFAVGRLVQRRGRQPQPDTSREQRHTGLRRARPTRWPRSSVRKTTIKTCSDFCTIQGNEQAAPVTKGVPSMSGISSINNQNYNAILLFARDCAAIGQRGVRGRKRHKHRRGVNHTVQFYHAVQLDHAARFYRIQRGLRRAGQQFPGPAHIGHRNGRAECRAAGRHGQREFGDSIGREPGLPGQRHHAAERLQPDGLVEPGTGD